MACPLPPLLSATAALRRREVWTPPTASSYSRPSTDHTARPPTPQLTDIADAAIVTRLWEALLASGADVVATSNRRPSELYSGGLNRHVYIPSFCEMLERHGVVQFGLESEGGDYREVRT